MVVNARAEKAGVRFGMNIFCGQPVQVLCQRDLVHPRRDIQLLVELKMLWDRREQIVKGADADSGQHFRPVAVRVGDIGHAIFS